MLSARVKLVHRRGCAASTISDRALLIYYVSIMYFHVVAVLWVVPCKCPLQFTNYGVEYLPRAELYILPFVN